MSKMDEKTTNRTEENTPLNSNSDTLITEQRSTTSTPRWVKIFGIIALVIVLLVVVLHLTGKIPMGHGGHMSNGLVDHTLVIENRVQ